jgi:two-component system LytT family response regulator
MKGIIRAVIVDDESSGRNSLKLLLDKNCPNVEVVSTSSSVEEAILLIASVKPDLVFLDIEMPERNGFDLLNHFTEVNFSVIFVTAYDKYAMQAIKLNALDYLLKPVRSEDLVLALKKVELGTLSESKLLISNFKKNYTKLEKLAIPIREGFSFVDLSEIMRCQADVNYSIIFLKSGSKIISSKTLGEYEDILEDFGFIRIHKSHIINFNHVKTYSKGEGGVITMADGVEIPVSRRKRDEFLSRINSPK